MTPLLPKEDDYSPVVSSPLNPTSAYQIQTKQHRYKRRIKVVGRTATKQSPTESLLRHKAAVAFQNQAAAAEAVREPKQDVLDSSGSRGGTMIHHGLGDDLGDIGLVRTGSEIARIAATATEASRGSAADAASRALAAAVVAAAAAANSRAAHCSRRAGPYNERDEKQPLTTDNEYLVDFSGVTIEGITTVVLMPQQRALFACTPSRMLWALAFFSMLLVLIYLRLQALFERYLKP